MILNTVDALILYAKYHLGLTNKLDQIYFRNLILNELKLAKPNDEFDYTRDEEMKNLDVPDILIKELEYYLINELKLSKKDAELKYTKIIGIITPKPSEVVGNFQEIYNKSGDAAALDYLYNLSIHNYYFQKTNVDKNLIWTTNFKDKNIEISINLSKPEKSNKDIAKAAKKPIDGEKKYPQCLLCLENLGYQGSETHPARENIRVIPVKLDDSNWYIQYSPYGYFKKHCIVFSEEHSNMTINDSTFRKLTDFVNLYPSFFIGSNADLPIVGGSILSHEHYQGGEHLLPVMRAKAQYEFKINKYNDAHLYKLDWYNTCLLIESKNKNHVCEIASSILKAWRNYDDYSRNIVSHTGMIMHNTITPSVRKVGEVYKMYLILRNNYCNEEFKEGIFHAHPEYHHIKKESIGIIEAMGLFILPARLIRQINEVKDCLANNLDNSTIINKYEDMHDFLAMINELKVNYSKQTIDQTINHYIENVCVNILKNTAVFKDDLNGEEGLKQFIRGIDL